MSNEYGVGIEPGIDIEISPHYDLWMRGATTGNWSESLEIHWPNTVACYRLPAKH